MFYFNGYKFMKDLLRSAVALAVAMSAVSVSAQERSSSEDKELEHVLVSVPGERTEAETALPITLLKGNELRNSVANTIGETLNTKPGLASASFGPSVGQPIIRGQQGARVTVLQSSMQSADASSLSADHAVSVEPVLAESIEVLRGPSTMLYGGGAIGGVVNVIDKRIPTEVPEQETGALELRHGSVNDESTAVVTIDTGSGNIALHLDALYRESNNVDIPGLAAHMDEHDDHEEDHEEEHEEHHDEETTDGYIANTDSATESFTLGLSYILDNGYIGFSANRLNNEYGIPAGAHAHHEEHEEHEEEGGEEHHEEEGEEEEVVRLEIEQTRYDMRAELNDISDHVDMLRWSLAYTDYEHVELEGPEVGTQWRRESWENRLELRHNPWQGCQGVMGLQIQFSELDAVGDESYIPESDTHNYGVFLVESYESGDWIYELGARLDNSSIDTVVSGLEESFNSVSLSASALWQIDTEWSLAVALSSSERAPVAEELFSNALNDFGSYVEHVATGSIEVGDSNLSTEQSNNVDLTLNYKDDVIDGYVTLFYNDFEDYIYLNNTEMLQDETAVYNYLQEDATFQGVEFEVSFALGQQLGGDFSLDIFGDWLDGELDRSGDVPRLPPQRLGSRVNYQNDALSAYVSVVQAEDQDKPGLFEEDTEGYTRWDAGLTYCIDVDTRKELVTFLRLKNLSDEEIRNSTSFLREIAPEAGRSIEAGFRINF